MPDIDDIKRIAEVEFAEIVMTAYKIEHKLRIILIDGSFIDAQLSRRLPDKFGFHWERMDPAGTIYRYDNFPDKNWKTVETYPHHFHNGSQDAVDKTPFPLTALEGFRAFMEFVSKKLK